MKLCFALQLGSIRNMILDWTLYSLFVSQKSQKSGRFFTSGLLTASFDMHFKENITISCFRFFKRRFLWKIPYIMCLRCKSKDHKRLKLDQSTVMTSSVSVEVFCLTFLFRHQTDCEPWHLRNSHETDYTLYTPANRTGKLSYVLKSREV